MELYHSIIGLPFSGKTTFLAALWHLLDAGEVNTAFRLDRLKGDNQYLNVIVDAWRQCKPVPRTSMGAETSVEIHARMTSNGQAVVLGFPDLSGESFEQQFAARMAKRDYVTSYEQDGGILLFVSANKPTDGITLADLGSEILDTGGNEHTVAPAGNVAANERGADSQVQLEATVVDASIEWKHSLVPQQVQLVDLLQLLQRPPFSRRRRKIVVAVSAWDVITDVHLEPWQWLAREMPLLHQFLTHNPDSFELRVCGVSAQGGNISGQDRTELLKSTPSERVRCIGITANIHDLTAPIAWLSEID